MKKTRIVILAIVIVAAICTAFYIVNNNSKKESAKEAELTEIQKITTRNMEKDYPATPREVIKFYNRIIKCYYGRQYSDDELEQLADQALSMFDDDLLKKNEKGAEIKVSIETIELSNIYCDKVLKNKEHIDYVAFIEHWYPNSIVGRYTFTEIGEDGTLLCMDMETYALVQFKPDYVLCSNLAEGDEIVVWKILLDANLKENSQSETKIIYCVTK